MDIHLFFYQIILLVLGIGNIAAMLIQAKQTQENKYQYKDITTSYGT